VPDSLFHNLSKFLWSNSWPGTLHFILHSPHISSPNHCLLFATHAHTIATCFAVVLRLCHLILVSLNPLLGTLSCSFTPHIQPFSSLPAAVPPYFPFLWARSHFDANTTSHTTAVQSLSLSLSLAINDISLLVSNGTNCLNLFHPIRILVSAAVSASPSTLTG